MKVPFTVVCVDNSGGVESFLTKGKTYKVIGSTIEFYIIENCELGERLDWFQWRFTKVESSPFDILDELPVG